MGCIVDINQRLYLAFQISINLLTSAMDASQIVNVSNLTETLIATPIRL